MKVFISGGLGFVGKTVAMHLAEKGHKVLIADLPANPHIPDNRIAYMSADMTSSGLWQKEVESADLIINLAGVSIFGRWTAKRKKAIYDSRILTTRNIVDAIPAGKKVTLYSTSAQGYYGFRGDERIDENATSGNDFLASVCRDWEKEAFRAQEKGTRVVITRFGIVLGKGGGVLGIMEPLFRYFLGGALGNGKQWFSWIHLEDLVGAYVFLLENTDIAGPVNLCAPNPVTNAEFSASLGKALHRPSIMPVPSFAVKVVLGEFGETLLHGQRVIPSKLLKAGYNFIYPSIENALMNIFYKTR